MDISFLRLGARTAGFTVSFLLLYFLPAGLRAADDALTCSAQFSHYYANNPDSVHFYPLSTAQGYYHWTFGDGTSSTQQYPWHYYNQPGTYYVCLTMYSSGAYCTWCDSVTVGGTPPCNAQFSHYSASNPDSVHFYATGTPGTTSYWNFGDGSTGTGQNPWHVYSAPGTYYVCHYVNNMGVTCNYCDSVTVTAPACNAHYIHYASPSHPDSVYFYPNGTTATAWYWNFGDGTTSTAHNPWHVYSSPGSYYVCLTISPSPGVYCNFCDTVVVTGAVPCNAAFSHYSISNPDSMHFYPSVTNAVSYYWSFGDGTTSSLATPWHYWMAPGTYNVCLTINMGQGTYCTHCDTVIVTAAPPCNAHFAHYTLGNPDSVHFYPSGPQALGYSWNFGDGTTSNQQSPWHHYAQPGTYYVCLTLSPTTGVYCQWCDSVTVTGLAPCTSQFGHYSLNNPDSVHFYPTGVTAGSYYWNFGDGSTSTAEYPWHHYANAGTYYVCLTIIHNGSYCTHCDSVTVTHSTVPCNASFSWYFLNNTDSLHYYPTGTTSGTHYWSFGDGSTSTGLYPWHHYAQPGTYWVCHYLTVSGNNCNHCDSVHVTGSNAFYNVARQSGSDPFVFEPPQTTGTAPEPAHRFRVFPNPSNDNLQFLSEENGVPVRIQLVDIAGRVLFAHEDFQAGILNLSTSALPEGIYIWTAASEGKILESGKVMIVH